MLKVIPPLVVLYVLAPTSTEATAEPLELKTWMRPEEPMLGAPPANVMRSCGSGQTFVPFTGG